jgi:hypothetical protein
MEKIRYYEITSIETEKGMFTDANKKKPKLTLYLRSDSTDHCFSKSNEERFLFKLGAISTFIYEPGRSSIVHDNSMTGNPCYVETINRSFPEDKAYTAIIIDKESEKLLRKTIKEIYND